MRKWLSENKDILKDILWKPAVRIVGLIYMLLAFIPTYIVWFIPSKDHPKIEYIQLVTWRYWVIIIPALTFVLICLIVWAALRAVATRTSAPMSLVKGPAPNIVCLGDDDLYVELDRHEVFREIDHREYAMRAVTVKFCNEPEPPNRVGSVSNVQARILYYQLDYPDRVEQEVHYACWLDEESPFVSFDVNKLHHLIIGTFQLKPEGGYTDYFTVYGNNLDKRKSLSRYRHQERRGFRVKVKLVAGEHGEFGHEDEFEIEINAGEYFSVDYLTEERKEQKRQLFISQLMDSVNEGERLFAELVAPNLSEFFRYAHEWRNKTDELITNYLGKPTSWRFWSTTDLKHHPNGNSALDDFYTQFLNLKEIATEQVSN